MKRMVQWPLRYVVLPLMTFAACARSTEPSTEVLGDDAGIPDAGTFADAGDGGENSDARPADAEALRCSNDFCIADLPSAGANGFARWLFVGLQADPIIGLWALASGEAGVDQSTAQLLHFENDEWKPIFAPTLGSGAGKRNIRLTSLASNGAGKLLAVGATIDDGTPVIVTCDGTASTTTAFESPLSAAWYAKADEAWVTGPAGGIFHSTQDGGWKSESRVDGGGEFGAVWGSGPNDVYVGGTGGAEWQPFGFLGHRTVGEDGGAQWDFRSFDELQSNWYGEYTITAGVAIGGGTRFWASAGHLARGGGDGGPDDPWAEDSFVPRVTLRSFWARNENDIWAAGHVGHISHFDGAAWTKIPLVFNGAPLTAHLKAITVTSAGDVFVVGEDVALRRKAK